MMAKFGIRVLLLVAIGSTFACDRLTKHVAATTLAGTPGRSFLADTVRLEYAENQGAFLGLGAGWPAAARHALFIGGSLLLLLAVATVSVRLRWRRLALVGVALLVSGGLSNLIDRLTYGKVIDFMNLGVGPVRTGIFNVADVAIMVGMSIVVIASLLSERNAMPRD